MCWSKNVIEQLCVGQKMSVKWKKTKTGGEDNEMEGILILHPFVCIIVWFLLCIVCCLLVCCLSYPEYCGHGNFSKSKIK